MPDWITRAAAGPGRLTIIPDAWIDLRRGDRRVQIAAEVDLGSEGIAVLRDKLRAYTTALNTGGLSVSSETLTLLIVLDGRGAARADRLRELLRVEWSGASFVVPLDAVGPGLFDQLFRSVGPPVTGSRYGSGRDEGATLGEAAVSDVAGGGPSADGDPFVP